MACINTFGSFTCDCGDGKQYDLQAKKCIGKWNASKGLLYFLRNLPD